MTKIKPLQALPTVFAVIAIAGIITLYATRGMADTELLSAVALMISGGVVLTFGTSLLSVIVAFAKASIRKERIPRIVWLNVMWLCATVFALAVYVLSWGGFAGA